MSLENFENINVYLEGFHPTSKKTLENLKQELKKVNNIESVKEEEHLILGELAIAIFIKLAATLVVALLKKTDAWDRLVNFLQKIFRIGKNRSANPEELKLVLKYQRKTVTINSDSKTEIIEKLEILKNYI